MDASAVDPPVSEAVRGRPAPPLRPFVAAYHGYRQRGVAPARHRGLPSPFLTLIFTLDEPLQISQHVDPRQRPGCYVSLVGGMHTSPALIRHDGAQSGIQLLVSPLGARALLGLPAGELTSTDLPAVDVLGPLAADVHEQLREAPSWAERFDVLDRMLQRRIGDEPPLPAEVRYVWQRQLRSGGTIPVSELAADVGWSTRHLANRFRREVGLSPKAAARVIRFDKARHMLRPFAAGPVGLADVAADCGYFDQSHLTREFTALAGCAPSRWIVEEFGNLQASTLIQRPESGA